MESKLEGIWQMVRAEFAGEPAPELVTTHTRVHLGVETYEVRYDGELADRGSLERGESTSHLTLQLRGIEGQNAGRTIPCIFQITGDRLRICYGLDGVLPDAFKTRPGEQRYLAVYRRMD